MIMLHIVRVNEDVDVISHLVLCELTNRRSLKLVGLLSLGVCPLCNYSPSQIFPCWYWGEWILHFIHPRHCGNNSSAILSIPIYIVKKTNRYHKKKYEEQEVHGVPFLSRVHWNWRCFLILRFWSMSFQNSSGMYSINEGTGTSCVFACCSFLNTFQ